MALATIEKQGDVLTVRLECRLDTPRTPLVDQELQPHLSDDIRHIVMDFSHVEYITSSGLRLLLWLEQLMEDRGGEVQVIHAVEPVQKVFQLSGFMNVIHFIPD